MSVEHIVLGLLEYPSTGYQIKRDFDEVFNNFWSAEQSQIYRTLKSLEERGLLQSSTEPSDKGPARRVYRRTPAGRAALLEWLARDADLGDFRIPYLAQIFFLDQLDDLEQTERVLLKVRNHFAERLEILSGHDAEWRASYQGEADVESGEDFFAHLVLSHGMARAEAIVRWADEAIARTRSRARDQEEIGRKEGQGAS